MKKKRGLLLQTTKEINMGSGVSGIGFCLFVAAKALKMEIVAAILVFVFGLISVWMFFSAMEARSKDKEAVSYNLLWGTGALALLLCGSAAATVKLWLGL